MDALKAWLGMDAVLYIELGTFTTTQHSILVHWFLIFKVRNGDIHLRLATTHLLCKKKWDYFIIIFLLKNRWGWLVLILMDIGRK